MSSLNVIHHTDFKKTFKNLYFHVQNVHIAI